MPPVVAAIASAVAGTAFALGASLATTAVIFAATSRIVVTLAVNAVISLASRALSGRPKGTRAPEAPARDVTVASSVAPRPIIFGQIRVSGVMAFIGTAGSRNEYLDYVICLAGHQVEAIDDIWFDNIQIPNSDWNSGTGAVTGGTYSGKASIWKYLGTDAQTADSTIDGAYTEWTSNHRLRGVAYLVIRLTLDDKVFPNGPPQNFYALVKGARVYDPRLDSTNGGAGSHRYTDATTWAYSNNAALCQTSYLMGGSIVFDTNSTALKGQLGFGAVATDIDWTTVAAAANTCDENCNIPPSGTQKRYTCDGLLSTANNLADNMEQLLTASIGQLVYSGGKYKLYAGAYQSPSISITPDDLAGQIELVTGVPRDQRYNAVQGTYFSAVSWAEIPFSPRLDSTYETRDGSRRLVRDIELPFTTNEYRAQRIAEVLLNQSENQQVMKWPGQISCFRVGLWETVLVTVSELNMTTKVFRCIGWEFSEDGGVELTLREETSTAYTDLTVPEYGSLATVTPTPNVDAQYRPQQFRVPSDPHFRFSTAQLHWYWGAATGVSISATGGVVGGYLQLTGDSTNKNIYSVPWPPYPYITQQRFRVTIRWMRTGTLAGLDAITVYLVAGDGTYPPTGFVDYGMYFTISSMNAETVNEWKEYSQEITTSNAADNLTQQPFLCCAVVMGNGTTSGSVRISGFDAVLVG